MTKIIRMIRAQPGKVKVQTCNVSRAAYHCFDRCVRQMINIKLHITTISHHQIGGVSKHITTISHHNNITTTSHHQIGGVSKHTMIPSSDGAEDDAPPIHKTYTYLYSPKLIYPNSKMIFKFSQTTAAGATCPY